MALLGLPRVQLSHAHLHCFCNAFLAIAADWMVVPVSCQLADITTQVMTWMILAFTLIGVHITTHPRSHPFACLHLFHQLTHSVTYPLAHSLSHSRTHPVACWHSLLTRSLTHSLSHVTRTLTHLLTHSHTLHAHSSIPDKTVRVIRIILKTMIFMLSLFGPTGPVGLLAGAEKLAFTSILAGVAVLGLQVCACTPSFHTHSLRCCAVLHALWPSLLILQPACSLLLLLLYLDQKPMVTHCNWGQCS